jgi:hypothetical protein
MKTEAEIRRHRDNLRTCQHADCGCPGTVHEDECRRGSEMMTAVERTLSWILGECPAADQLVAEMDASARRIRAAGAERN